MRENNWKTKAIVAVACILSILAGVAVAVIIPQAHAEWKGLAGFGTFIVLVLLVTFVLTKITSRK